MTEKPPPPNAKTSGDHLSPQCEARLEALIGNKLRSYYGELLAEPIPNRILDLLGQLEAKEQQENAEPGKFSERG